MWHCAPGETLSNKKHQFELLAELEHDVSVSMWTEQLQLGRSAAWEGVVVKHKGWGEGESVLGRGSLFHFGAVFVRFLHLACSACVLKVAGGCGGLGKQRNVAQVFSVLQLPNIGILAKGKQLHHHVSCLPYWKPAE